MKKFLTVALAAIMASALAAVAVAQTSDWMHTSTQSVSPTKAGTAKKPVNGKINMRLFTPREADTTVNSFAFYFPKQIRVKTAGFKYCTVNAIVKNGNLPPAKCGKAKAGTGLATAFIGRRGGSPVTLDVTIYTGSKTTLTVYVAARELPQVRAAFAAKIQDADRAGFKQRLKAVIPHELQSPAIGVYVVLDSVQLIVGRKPVTRWVNGRKKTFRLVQLRGCAANRLHTLGSELEYTKPDNAPNTFARGTVPCKKA